MRCPTLNELPPPPPNTEGWPWTEETPQLPEKMPDGKNWPKISVVTPNYNYEQFLEETIRAILLQGYPNLEYLIIDDGSTDESLEIIRKYENFLAYWVSQENSGQSNAINTGFAKSTGDILCWYNSDDFPKAGALEFAAHLLPDTSIPAWGIGACEIIDGTGQILFTQYPHDEMTHEHLFRWVDKHWFPQQSTFWTKALWELAGPLQEELRYVMDLALWFAMYDVVKPVTSSQVVSRYRFHESANTIAGLYNSREEALRVFEAYLHQRSPEKRRVLPGERWVGEEVLEWAHICYQRHLYQKSWQYWKYALHIYPAILTNRAVYTLLAKFFLKTKFIAGLRNVTSIFKIS